MERYWNDRIKLTAPTNPTAGPVANNNCDSILSEFDHHRLALLANQTQDEGWLLEKCQDLPANVTKDTDIVEWWQVSVVFALI